MTQPAFALDPLLLEPKRLQICGSLGAVDELEFGTLRDVLGVADSVLSKHLKTLDEAGYVAARKQRASTGRPRTWITLTRVGQRALQGHVAALRRLAGDLAPETAAQAPLTSPPDRLGLPH
ncbi:MAG TPA: transcriptional regulator [Dermatophilaceae bacterium]|nr:transcriptional regulator [Dermatophilaceae bacterium]HMT90990.1 transcriptional regulator [Dermatophilaceae bacterium]